MYNGTYNNEVVEMHIGIKELPTYGMCTDLTRFYTFYKGKFIEFYSEGETVEKWFLTTESLHRLHNGKWRDFNKKSYFITLIIYKKNYISLYNSVY